MSNSSSKPSDFRRRQLWAMTKWSDLFTPRQLVALTTFSDLVGEAREQYSAGRRCCRSAGR